MKTSLPPHLTARAKQEAVASANGLSNNDWDLWVSAFSRGFERCYQALLETAGVEFDEQSAEIEGVKLARETPHNIEHWFFREGARWQFVQMKAQAGAGRDQGDPTENDTELDNILNSK